MSLLAVPLNICKLSNYSQCEGNCHSLLAPVYFPNSDYVGWVHGDFTTRYPRRGYAPIPAGQGYE